MTTTPVDRNEAIAAIKAALKRRSNRAWSVTGGRGTAWGWIYVTAPPRRRTGSMMAAEDIAELSRLFGSPVHVQGVRIPASSAYRREWVDRAEGREPSVIAEPYWD